jgi:predicted DNA-binding protein with PD1-like motif
MNIYATRLTQGQDLKKSIEDFVKNQGLSSATIVSAVGSLERLVVRMAGATASTQDIRTLDGPFEIVSLVGNLGQERTHLHISVSDKSGAVKGGHLKEGSIVHTTVELVLVSEPSLTFAEKTDNNTGFGELEIQKH